MSTAEKDINLPDVLAEVRSAYERYQEALTGNDVDTLNRFFHDDPRTIRYGGRENLYGYSEIAAFRSMRPPGSVSPKRSKTVITSYGRDFAVASTLFHPANASHKVGRQMQTWVRFDQGWRVVAAHVSVIEEAASP